MAFDKARLHHKLVVIRRIKLWQLLLLLVAFGGLSAFLLRQNNLGMVERRNLVKQADEQNGNVQQALTNLGQYVTSHMNTNLGEGIFLEHSYQRAYDAALQAAANAVNPNSAVYIEVEKACQADYARHHVFSRYIQCVQDKLKAMAPGSDPLAHVKAPAPELFIYNFVSPGWSPDLAGFMVVLTLLIGLLIALRVLGYVALKLVLKAHKR